MLFPVLIFGKKMKNESSIVCNIPLSFSPSLPPPLPAPFSFVFAQLFGWQWFATDTVKMVVNVLLQTSASVNLGGTDLPAVQVTPLQLPCSWGSVSRTSRGLKFGSAWLRQQRWAAAYGRRASAFPRVSCCQQHLQKV